MARAAVPKKLRKTKREPLLNYEERMEKLHGQRWKEFIPLTLEEVLAVEQSQGAPIEDQLYVAEYKLDRGAKSKRFPTMDQQEAWAM